MAPTLVVTAFSQTLFSLIFFEILGATQIIPVLNLTDANLTKFLHVFMEVQPKSGRQIPSDSKPALMTGHGVSSDCVCCSRFGELTF